MPEEHACEYSVSTSSLLPPAQKDATPDGGNPSASASRRLYVGVPVVTTPCPAHHVAARPSLYAALAKFGELALRSGDLDEVLAIACRLAEEAVSAGFVQIVEFRTVSGSMKVCASARSASSFDGSDTVDGYALTTDGPVLGVVAIVGGFLFSFFGAAPVTGLNIYSMIGSMIGAVVVLFIYHAVTGRSRAIR